MEKSRVGSPNYNYLSYNDGRNAAKEDLIDFGIARALEIAGTIASNGSFSESYKTGYENTISAYRPKSNRK